MSCVEYERDGRARLGHLPLMYVLLAVVCGYTYAACAAHLVYPWVLGIFLLSLPRTRWFGAWVLAAAVMAMFYTVRLPLQDVSWRQYPPRQVGVEIQINRIIKRFDRYGRTTGYATVTRAPTHLTYLVGQRAYYCLNAENLVKPRTVSIKNDRTYWEYLNTSLAPSSWTDRKKLHHFFKHRTYLYTHFPHTPHYVYGKRSVPPSVHLVRSGTYSVQCVCESVVPENNFLHTLYFKHIHWRLGHGAILSEVRPPHVWYRSLDALMQRVESYLTKGANSRSADAWAVARAMILGKTDALTYDQKNAFLWTGTMHVFSISGLHVGIVVLVFLAALNLLPLPRNGRGAVAMIMLLFYVEMTGGMPSAWRAYGMLLLWWGGQWFGRKSTVFGTLTATAVVALLIDPKQLWDPGFQLSYTIVAALTLYGVPLADALVAALPKFSRHGGVRALFLSLGVSFAATVAALPLTAYYFNIVSPGAILLNIVMIPLATLVLASGTVSILCGLLGAGFLCSFVNHATWTLITFMTYLLDFATRRCHWLSATVQAPSLTCTLMATVGVLAACVAVSYAKNSNKWLWLPILPAVTCVLAHLV